LSAIFNTKTGEKVLAGRKGNGAISINQGARCKLRYYYAVLLLSEAQGFHVLAAMIC
jgi:hypothetical protein